MLPYRGAPYTFSLLPRVRMAQGVLVHTLPNMLIFVYIVRSVTWKITEVRIALLG